MRLSHIYRIQLEKNYTTLVDAAYFREKENVLTQSETQPYIPNSTREKI